MQINKTNKNNDSFSIDKLSKSLDFIFKDLKVNKQDLLRDFEDLFLSKKELKSLEIYDLLINTSIKKCLFNGNNFDDLDWRFVASRLKLKKLYKEISINRKINKLKPYSNFENFYNNFILLKNNNIYSSLIERYYSKEFIENIYTIINPEYDLQYDYAGINILYNSYLTKFENKHVELPQEMYLLIALTLTIPYINLIEEKNENIILNKVTEIYNNIASLKISLATPILLNMRKATGGYTSCILTAISDDTTSMFHSFEQMAKLSSDGAGIGINISRIRAKGSWVRGEKGNSSGVINYVKLMNDIALTFDQAGKRSGSFTIALDSWHLDIEDFLELQTENGDLRNKAFDIFPQIVVSDLFMRRVDNNKDWLLLDPYEVKEKYNIELCELYGKEFEELYERIERESILELTHKVKAKELFKKIMKTSIETGMPFICFKDHINNVNPNKDSGMIGNFNLCNESFSNFSPTKIEKKDKINNKFTQQVVEMGYTHTCNLVSLNLSLLLDFSSIANTTKVATEIENYIIDLCDLSTVESNNHNMDYRVIGIGIMGLHDHLAYNKIQYSKSSKYANQLMEVIQFNSLKESNNLVDLYNKTYKFFPYSEYRKGIICGKDENWFKENETYIDTKEWLELIDKIKTKGLINGSLNNIPPNTRTSLVCGTTSSFLPVFSKFFIDKNSSGNVPIAPKYLSKDTFWYYQENKNLDQNVVVDVASNLQQWIDQGISMELWLNHNTQTAVDIYNLFMNAWKSKTKGIYYTRQIKTSQKKEECISCSN